MANVRFDFEHAGGASEFLIEISEDGSTFNSFAAVPGSGQTLSVPDAPRFYRVRTHAPVGSAPSPAVYFLPAPTNLTLTVV